MDGSGHEESLSDTWTISGVWKAHENRHVNDAWMAQDKRMLCNIWVDQDKKDLTDTYPLIPWWIAESDIVGALSKSNV